MARKNEEDIKSKCTKMFVAAIDFGTTYSGYAFSFKSDWRKVIHQTCTGDQFVSSKAPTALLLKPNKSFCAFGFGAERAYMDMTSVNNSDSDSDSEEKPETETRNKNWKDYYFFQRFKMLLHKDEMLHRNSEIQDITGKRMKAMDVFSISIRHLKDSMLKEMNDKVLGVILETDVEFVLTVPAIWGDAAKMFMREAAVEAGISTDQLTLALEPEAASIYCQFFHPKDNNENETPGDYDAFRQVVKEKRKYMVVDLGGGTVDITVHKQAEDGTLEEMIPATGGPMGGTTVDKAFEAFLETIGGEGVLETFKKSFMEDYLILFTEFESKKRCGGDSDNSKVNITLPLELERLLRKNCGCTLSIALEKSQFQGRVTYKNKTKKIIFESLEFRSFFQEAVDGVTQCIEDILKKESCADLTDIIMVGGFSESKFIQKSLREKFKSHRFIVPDESGLAVLNGAVYFGHIPDAISKRVSRFTYGVQICRKFKPVEDPEDRKISLGGIDRCVGVMHPIVRRGDRIEAGMECHHSFQALKHEKGKFDCGIYISDQREPKFVDDKGCRCLGMLEIEISDIKRGTYAEIEETFIFGETELTFRAKHLGSGRPVEQTFDMLNQHAQKLPPANK